MEINFFLLLAVAIYAGGGFGFVKTLAHRWPAVSTALERTDTGVKLVWSLWSLFCQLVSLTAVRKLGLLPRPVNAPAADGKEETNESIPKPGRKRLKGSTRTARTMEMPAALFET